MVAAESSDPMFAPLEPAERLHVVDVASAPPVPTPLGTRMVEDGWVEALYIALGTLAIVAWAAIAV
jgi:hypothetical protein